MGSKRDDTTAQSESRGGRPLVSLASLGGTITMVPDGDGGIVPTLSAEDLVGSVPELAEIADLRATTLYAIPGASLSLQELLAAVDWARAEVAGGATGVVLMQGTDTLEETSYLAELVWDLPEPLIFIGAMRGPMQLSADGPANLAAACRVAISPAARDKGVMVVLDNTIHHASLVHKAHSTALSAFESYDGLKLGRVIEDEVYIRSFERPGQPIDEAGFEAHFVPMWTCWLGDDGTALQALAELEPAGAVVAALGVGHVSFGVADAMEKLATHCPVVLCTRIGEGGSMRRTYGFQGSEMDLQRRGVLVSGALDAPKSRILLALLVGIGADANQIVAEFATRGRFF